MNEGTLHICSIIVNAMYMQANIRESKVDVLLENLLSPLSLRRILHGGVRPSTITRLYVCMCVGVCATHSRKREFTKTCTVRERE